MFVTFAALLSFLLPLEIWREVKRISVSKKLGLPSISSLSSSNHSQSLTHPIFTFEKTILFPFCQKYNEIFRPHEEIISIPSYLIPPTFFVQNLTLQVWYKFSPPLKASLKASLFNEPHHFSIYTKFIEAALQALRVIFSDHQHQKIKQNQTLLFESLSDNAKRIANADQLLYLHPTNNRSSLYQTASQSLVNPSDSTFEIFSHGFSWTSRLIFPGSDAQYG